MSLLYYSAMYHCGVGGDWHEVVIRGEQTEQEMHAREAIIAAAQQLPEGIAGVAGPVAPQGICSVCCVDQESEDNHLLQCDRCGAFVHMGCYGVAAAPEGRQWLCDVCQLGVLSSTLSIAML